MWTGLTSTRIQEVDEFIADLWKVHLKVKEQGYVQVCTTQYLSLYLSNMAQKLSLGLYRSDYMVHQDLEDSKAAPTIKQVELNTIAASFGGLSSKSSDLHK